MWTLMSSAELLLSGGCSQEENWKRMTNSQSLKTESARNIVGLLKDCTRQKDLLKGSQVHAYIREHKALETNSYIANTLVNMYAKCGALPKAQELFKALPVQSVVTWNTLIAAYAQQGQGEAALKSYHDMQREGHFPNAITFTCALKACGSIGAAVKGAQIHKRVVSLGMLEKDAVLGSALVDMYAKCGALIKAQEVFEDLPVRDVVTWNALIAGYAQQGQGEEALKCYDSMQCEGHIANAVTFTCALKACAIVGATAKGEEIHDKINNMRMLDKDTVLGNTLVDMYAKCGALAKAKQVVLNELPVRVVATWSTLIAGYAQQGYGEEALKCLDSMQHDGHCPDVITFMFALKACATIGATARGAQIHDQIVGLGMLQEDIILGSSLVDMYAKCGALTMAQQLVQELPLRDVVTWNALITGYAQQGQWEEVLKHYDNMQHDGHFPDAVTFTCAFRACGSIGTVAKGEEIHDTIIPLGILEKDIVLGNALVDMYARFGAFAKAQQVLEELPVRDVVTWSALIAGYANQGLGHEALKCYDGLEHEGHSPNTIIFMCALKACGIIQAIAKGEQVHDRIIRLGMLEEDTMLGSTLVDMYAKCGALAKAQQVLEGLPVRAVVTWNALITGYAQQGQGEEALKCYDSMQRDSQSPDAVTFICVLNACGGTRVAAKGEEIHDKIVILGILEVDIVLGSTLVDMYAKCGALTNAQKVLEGLPVRDVVAWNVLTAGYVQQGQGEAALKCFDDMQHEGHCPNVISFTCALKACGIIGAVAKGQQIHESIAILGMVEENFMLGNTLVLMYAKCAAVGKALQVLKELPFQDMATWNVLIGGYAQQGQSLEALSCFKRMQSNGLKPDSTSLTCVLNACSHSGALDQAETFFSKMSIIYGIKPEIEHYSCMVDLFGRAGKFKDALIMVEKMPSADYLPLWVSLLGACLKWEEVKTGRLAFERALQLDKSKESVYLAMAKIYMAAGMQEDAETVEAMRVMNRAWEILDDVG